MRAPLIARASSLRQVIDLVQRHAVVTLVGPPGVGKSALAAHAFTALAPGIDGDSRWSDIAERPLDQPAPTRGRDLLIAIDNADAQRSSWLPIVEEVLRRDGSARLLCTARSALGIDGEIVCPVPTLDRPASLALLRELVPLSTPIEDLDIIASAFDGLPLGLALAAEAVNLRGIADVLTRIADRPDLLSGDPAVVRSVRHRNLATAISGSWAGLTPAAQTLLCRLSSGGGDHALADVFAAAADLDAAPAETLRLLVHYSLLATCDRADNGPRTYRVPRPIATYALGRAAG